MKSSSHPASHASQCFGLKSRAAALCLACLLLCQPAFAERVNLRIAWDNAASEGVTVGIRIEPFRPAWVDSTNIILGEVVTRSSKTSPITITNIIGSDSTNYANYKITFTGGLKTEYWVHVPATNCNAEDIRIAAPSSSSGGNVGFFLSGVIKTNGTAIGAAATSMDWTTGVTGYMSGATAKLGVSASGGSSDLSVTNALATTNQLAGTNAALLTTITNSAAQTSNALSRLKVSVLNGAGFNLNSSNSFIGASSSSSIDPVSREFDNVILAGRASVIGGDGVSESQENAIIAAGLSSIELASLHSLIGGGVGNTNYATVDAAQVGTSYSTLSQVQDSAAFGGYGIYQSGTENFLQLSTARNVATNTRGSFQLGGTNAMGADADRSGQIGFHLFNMDRSGVIDLGFGNSTMTTFSTTQVTHRVTLAAPSFTLNGGDLAATLTGKMSVDGATNAAFTNVVLRGYFIGAASNLWVAVSNGFVNTYRCTNGTPVALVTSVNVTNGNTGFGTATPTATLSVSGGVSVTGGQTNSGTIRAATLLSDGNVQAGNNFFNANASGAYEISGRMAFSAPGSGVYRFANSSSTDFNRVNFGGDTAAFPALGRSNGWITVTGGSGLFEGGNTNGFWLMGGGLLQDFTFTAPAAPSRQGALYWNDGTNVCVVIRNSAGGITTNKLTMSAWP